MAAKKKNFSWEKLLNLMAVIPIFVRLTDAFINLVKYETQQVRRDLIYLLILLLLMGTVLTSIWFCILAVLVLYFISLHLSWLSSLILVLILNLFLLLIILLLISLARNRPLYPETCQIIKKIFNRN